MYGLVDCLFILYVDIYIDQDFYRFIWSLSVSQLYLSSNINTNIESSQFNWILHNKSLNLHCVLFGELEYLSMCLHHRNYRKLVLKLKPKLSQPKLIINQYIYFTQIQNNFTKTNKYSFHPQKPYRDLHRFDLVKDRQKRWIVCGVHFAIHFVVERIVCPNQRNHYNGQLMSKLYVHRPVHFR